MCVVVSHVMVQLCIILFQFDHALLVIGGRLGTSMPFRSGVAQGVLIYLGSGLLGAGY